MIKTTRILFACIAAFFIQVSAGSDFFLFSKDIMAPNSLSSEIGSFCIDGDIYKWTNNDFTDLRIFDTDNKEVPFLLRYITANDTDTVHYSVNVEMENLVELPENRMALIFKRNEKDSIPSELFIQTPVINFEKSVSVYGSNDSKVWSTLKEKELIFDYSQFVDVRNTTVRFEKKNFIYYKVAIDNVRQVKLSPFSEIVSESGDGAVKKKYTTFIEKQEKFRLEQISFFGYAQNIRYGERQKNIYKITIASLVEDTIEKITEMQLISNREPLQKLTLTVKEPNFRRNISLDGTNDTTDKPQWQQLGNSDIYSIKTGAFHNEKLDIALNGTYRFLKYRLKISNKDNAPLDVEAVSAEGNANEVLFFHRNKLNFKVFYGCNDVNAPQYDVAFVLESAPVINKTLWIVGSQIVNKVEHKRGPLIKSKYILFGSLFLMVAVLAGVLFMVVGKVEQSEK